MCTVVAEMLSSGSGDGKKDTVKCVQLFVELLSSGSGDGKKDTVKIIRAFFTTILR